MKSIQGKGTLLFIVIFISFMVGYEFYENRGGISRSGVVVRVSEFGPKKNKRSYSIKLDGHGKPKIVRTRTYNKSFVHLDDGDEVDVFLVPNSRFGPKIDTFNGRHPHSALFFRAFYILGIPIAIGLGVFYYKNRQTRQQPRRSYV